MEWRPARLLGLILTSALAGCAAADKVVDAGAAAPAPTAAPATTATAAPASAAPASAAPSDWKLREAPDPVTGRTLSAAYVRAKEVERSGRLITIASAEARVVCDGSGQLLVRVQFSERVGATSNAVFGYRFDEVPGQRVPSARFAPSNYTYLTVSDRAEVAAFIAAAETATSLYVEVQSSRYGLTRATFPVQGGAPVLSAVKARCAG